MKKTLKLMLVALLAFGMFACGEKKVTEDDLKQAQAALFNEGMTTNVEAASKAMETFCTYVKQNPDDPQAPEWLFKAMEIAVRQKDAKKSAEICDKLTESYPKSERTPVAMFMLATLVYDDQLNDIDKAREVYEKILSDYPESEIAPSVEASLKYLGMSAEEIVKEFERMQETAESSAE